MKKNMNRVTVICLGVIDMKKSLQFYRDKLGFKTDETGDNPDVVLFSTPGTIFFNRRRADPTFASTNRIKNLKIN